MSDPGHPDPARRRVTGPRYVVAVASCKGGVGKTTIAVNVALALRRGGATIGLFDADLHGPNVPVMLGVRRTVNRFPLRGAGGAKTMEFIPLGPSSGEAYLQPIRRFGIQMFSTGLFYADQHAITDAEGLGSKLVARTLHDVVWGELDILLLDFPPGIGAVPQELLRGLVIDGIVVVTTPQEMALMDTGRALEFYRSCGVPIVGLVENMSHTVCPHCGQSIEVFCHHWEQHPAFQGLKLLGRVPLNPAITRPIDAYHPLTALDLSQPPAADFVAIAAAVQQRLAAGGTGGVS